MKKHFLLQFFLLSVAVQFCNGQCTPFIQAVPNTIFPCPGTCNGMIIINPFWISGTPPYTFTSNAGTIAPDQPNPGWTTIYNLCAGSQVTVTIHDSAGCTGVDFITLIEPPIANPSFAITPSCNSLFNGSVTIDSIPDWYFQRKLTVRNQAGTVVADADYNPGPNPPFVASNLLPGNYTFELSFQFTEYTTPSWYGCPQFFQFTVPAGTYPGASITPAGPTTFCSGGSVLLQAPVAANRGYQWRKNGNNIAGATSSSYTATTGGNYRVLVTNTQSGCSKLSSVATPVTINSLPAATITPQGPTTFCSGGSVLIKGNSGTGLTYQWRKNGTAISGATFKNYTANSAGVYKLKVTNSNGCSKISPGVTVSVPCKEGEIVSAESKINFTVYPNPNTGEFTITLSNKPTLPVQIEMTDAIGRVVKRFETSEETVVINESSLDKGIYCLTLRNNNEVVVKKISIVK